LGLPDLVPAQKDPHVYEHLRTFMNVDGPWSLGSQANLDLGQCQSCCFGPPRPSPRTKIVSFGAPRPSPGLKSCVLALQSHPWASHVYERLRTLRTFTDVYGRLRMLPVPWSLGSQTNLDPGQCQSCCFGPPRPSPRAKIASLGAPRASPGQKSCALVLQSHPWVSNVY